MGQHVYNATLLCDYATPDNDAAFELHMALPVSYDGFMQMQAWLSEDDWQSVEHYLSDRYPQHKDILTHWCQQSYQRKQGGVTEFQEKVA